MFNPIRFLIFHNLNNDSIWVMSNQDLEQLNPVQTYIGVLSPEKIEVHAQNA